MQDPTELGRNRTGLQMSPLHGELQLAGTADAADGAPVAATDPEALALARLRRTYIEDADALGSVPPPGTVTGLLKTGAAMLTGKRAQVLVDKLAERLAYERGGTRLYDAALAKASVLAEGTPVTLVRLREIRDQEVEHATLLASALRQIGADPTAQTPCADVVGVESQGLMQVVSDPRTSLSQTLHALLAAELIDVASWELLAKLARDQNQDELARRFEAALVHENQHLATLTEWFEAMTFADNQLFS